MFECNKCRRHRRNCYNQTLKTCILGTSLHSLSPSLPSPPPPSLTQTHPHTYMHALNFYLYMLCLDEPGFVSEDGDDFTQVAQFLWSVVQSPQPLHLAPLKQELLGMETYQIQTLVTWRCLQPQLTEQEIIWEWHKLYATILMKPATLSVTMSEQKQNKN